MKKILVNGKEQQTLQNHLLPFLNELQINTVSVAIAINNCVIPSSDYGSTQINQDDCIEIIQAVCGG